MRGNEGIGSIAALCLEGSQSSPWHLRSHVLQKASRWTKGLAMEQVASMPKVRSGCPWGHRASFGQTVLGVWSLELSSQEHVGPFGSGPRHTRAGGFKPSLPQQELPVGKLAWQKGYMYPAGPMAALQGHFPLGGGGGGFKLSPSMVHGPV